MNIIPHYLDKGGLAIVIPDTSIVLMPLMYHVMLIYQYNVVSVSACLLCACDAHVSYVLVCN